ncbi:hypothetical protein BD408DRAFT_425689, partial [Parasitella parasitica]
MSLGISLPSFPCSFFRLADRTRAVDLSLNPIMFEKCEHKVTRMVGQSLSPDVCVGQTLLHIISRVSFTREPTPSNQVGSVHMHSRSFSHVLV